MLQRLVVYLLQSRAAKQSDLLIADSQEIWGYFISRFPKLVNKFKAIRYGANECLTFQETDLEKYKVVKNEYFLVIARLVSENKADEIIRAYKQYIGRKKLLIVGAVENTAFVRNLKTLSNGKIVFADAIYDKQILDSLRQGCFIYIHGHSVGGTNPSLLEAMAAGCACLCHDNVFNLEVTEGNQIYFHSSYDLAILLNLLEHKSNDLDVLRIKALDRVKNKYTWDQICKSYIDLFHQLHSHGITDNNN